eukprot:Hpha_TRINITY_DN5817_c0_g1::TRINITY_DN5817_c0_g1_i2::g.45562::m.45562
MDWYASPSQSADSRVIQRLITATAAPLPPAAKAGDAAILFCRLPSRPFVCCGRVECVKKDLTASPLKFKWRLVDATGKKAGTVPTILAALSPGRVKSELLDGCAD